MALSLYVQWSQLLGGDHHLAAGVCPTAVTRRRTHERVQHSNDIVSDMDHLSPPPAYAQASKHNNNIVNVTITNCTTSFPVSYLWNDGR